MVICMLYVMNSHKVIARWEGYCASCPDERPLLLVSHGPHGLRAWLSGAGPEDRTLAYACQVCGRVEHVPLSEQGDAAYDATLPRWPDLDAALVTVTVTGTVAEPDGPVVIKAAPLVRGDVFGLAALQLARQVSAAVPVEAAAPEQRSDDAPAAPARAAKVQVTAAASRVQPTDLFAAA